MDVRLGQVLIDNHVLTEAQVAQALDRQQQTNEPFGVVCERLFNVAPRDIEDAWAIQYAGLTRRVDPRIEAVDPRALGFVTRRQAWQFRVLPLRFDERELMMATTQQHLRRALRFATNVIGVPVFFVLAAPGPLGEAMCKHCPLPGMTPASINHDAMDALLRAGA